MVNKWIKGEQIEESNLARLKRKIKEQTGLEIYSVSNKAINQYRNTTRENKNISYEKAILKINRNYLISKRILRETAHFKVVTYGNMTITFNKLSNKIIKIYNDKNGEHYYRRCDWKLKEKLDNIIKEAI